MKTAAKKTASSGASAAAKKAAPKKSAGSKGSSPQLVEKSKLMKLFEDELKDIYWAEKALTKALPKMLKKATSDELKEAIETHLAETEEQVKKVEKVFEMIGKKAQAKKCEAMHGLLKEGEEIMKETDAGAMRDAGIISSAQKVEHYEIATYGTLRTFASTMGMDDVATLLEEILDEEKTADEKLTAVAISSINCEAATEEE